MNEVGVSKLDDQQKLDWLKAWFASRGQVPLGCESKNYFELGLIDSFAVIELIEAVETKFQVRFSDEHFQKREFATMSGLAKIISELEK